MMRMVIVLFAACALGLGSAYAGKDLKNARPAQPIVDDGIEREVPPGQRGAYIPGLDKPTNLTWLLVDSMSNALGPANRSITPMTYDAATNVLAVLHRGATPYGASGQLWYNISRNAGATWRRVGELNGGAAQTCRYPSGAISNPAGTNDTAQCLFVYSAPNIENAGTFGQITYGVDFPLGGGAGSGTVEIGTNNYTSSTTIWTQPNSSWILWGTNASGTGVANDHTNWRTNDYVTVTRQIPPGWTDAEPYFINSLGHLTGMATSTGSYYSVSGLFSPDTLANAFNAGYSKSTNNGVTWGPWKRPQPDWMIATGLPPRYDLYDYSQPPGGTVQYNQDMVVDAIDRVHFFHVVVDSPWTTNDPRGILEVYETGTNTWAYKWVVQNLNTYTGLGYPGPSTPASPYLYQTGNAPHVSISPDRQVMTMVWLDAATQAPADSIPDIWFSWRRITGAAWSTPLNLTQTPGFPELLLHAAPILKSNGANSYTLFLGRTYQANINTYPPDYNLKSSFYVAAYTFTTTGVNETGQQPVAFNLEQNYPNPFNPSTTIRYSVAEAGRVSLKVFNTLGQEVATLVDENVAPGEHQATFDASKLSSGVYVYKISAGSRTESRKMLLLK